MRRAGAVGAGGWKVQPLACYEHGMSLRGLTASPGRHPLAADAGAAVVHELLIAAVCHSTNWDRLRERVFAVTSQERWAAPPALTADDFAAFYGAAFPAGEALGARHELWADAARSVADGRVDVPALLTAPVRLAGQDGLFSRLARVRAFAEDPQGKKSSVFAQQIVRHGLVAVADPESLRPAVEYHLIRLYLRTGRVAPATPAALGSLTEDKVARVDSLHALRQAVSEAMAYTADAAGVPVHELNDAEWQISRSFCTRDEARCAGPALPEKPCDPALLRGGPGCPFAATCTAGSGSAAAWSEPRLSSRYAFY